MRPWNRLLITAVLAACLLGVAGCALPSGQAQVPASGISGPNGGATETIYYDAMGKPHFQS